MKVLFDECVPKRLKRLLANHLVQTAPDAGWAGIKNGALLKKAAEKFDVFVTVDRNLSYQQNTQMLPIPIIVIHAKTNKLKDIEQFAAELILLLATPLSKAVYVIGE